MQVFLNEKLATFMGPLAKDMHDVGMGQTSQQPGLALQAPGFFRMGRKLWEENLTRQGTEISSAPDLI
jgi:hypothetical protein